MNTDEYLQAISDGLKEGAKTLNAVAKSNSSQIEQIVRAIVASLKAGGKILLCGNGGSAADAQHLACELVSKLKLERDTFPALALTTNTSILTAIANDYGFEHVFSRQVESLVGKNDVVIGISTSGNSPNVIKALNAAKAKGAKTIVLTNAGGGKMVQSADIVLRVPSHDTQRVQEAHIAIGHIICELVEREMVTG